MRAHWRLVTGIALSLGLVVGAYYLAVRLQRWQPLGYASRANELIYLPTAAQARLMSMGYTSVMADYYWVRALQYYTEPSLAANQYRNLGDILEVVVGIDPDFRYAYKFAGIAIPYDTGRLRFAHVDRSTSFLERGVERFPDNWELRFYLGFNYLNFHDQPQKAAEQFAAASKLPGAPAYLSAFAARVYTVGGQLDRAIAYTEATLSATEDPEVRVMMERRLRDLHGEKELRRVEAAAREFQEQMGRLPLDLDELIRSGLAPPPPGFHLDAEGIAHPPDDYERMVLYAHPDEPNLGVHE